MQRWISMLQSSISQTADQALNFNLRSKFSIILPRSWTEMEKVTMLHKLQRKGKPQILCSSLRTHIHFTCKPFPKCRRRHTNQISLPRQVMLSKDPKKWLLKMALSTCSTSSRVNSILSHSEMRRLSSMKGGQWPPYTQASVEVCIHSRTFSMWREWQLPTTTRTIREWSMQMKKHSGERMDHSLTGLISFTPRNSSLFPLKITKDHQPGCQAVFRRGNFLPLVKSVSESSGTAWWAQKMFIVVKFIVDSDYIYNWLWII